MDPLFVNRPAGDYRLSSASPCIDAGYNAALLMPALTDLARHARILDDAATADCRWSAGNCGAAPVVDMGAYEFVPSLPADFNHDGFVDSGDLSIFAACATRALVPYDPAQLPQGCTLTPDGSGHIAADFDQDLDVDIDDFAVYQRCISGATVPANPACAG
jgi:hypothetical protein